MVILPRPIEGGVELAQELLHLGDSPFHPLLRGGDGSGSWIREGQLYQDLGDRTRRRPKELPILTVIRS